MSMNSPSPNTSNTSTPSVATSALLNLNYGTVSILVIWVYEYAITFDDEITFLRDSKWCSVKIIYLLCRYFTFPLVITNTFHYLQQGLTLEECRSYFLFAWFARATVMFCAELMFLVRAYALWHRSRAALITIIVNFTAFLIPMTVILALFNSAFTTIPVPGITSCNDVFDSHLIVWAYILLVIGETEILLSTVSQAFLFLLCPSIFCGSDFDDSFSPGPVWYLVSQVTGTRTWDTGYSDAPFPVECGPKHGKSVKSE
ncbi:hypothetical protein PAXINDRAFT_20900 [Paxillus involutus ATCC 200175]|uniref:DUF6533 domain-containing protein n=1 Tax=Paxillus involutus ATCC 200175 TaxID=664439 RepID=A0A0C9TF25_PAXIN|nr:hypothetical protein PAXINDRAFT_20900 [Paxillus involutus ATCC 200175]